MILRTWGMRLAALLAVALIVPACGGGGGGKGSLIRVTLTSAATTSETGTTATISVVLAVNPTGNVTIAVSSSDPGEGTPDTALLTFTPANGTTPQVITVTGQDDAAVDGNQAYTLQLAAAASSDLRFNGRDPADVALTNLDDDVVAVAGITVTPIALGDILEGNQATFDVSLNSVPTADVTVPITVTTGVGDVTVSGFGSGGDVVTFNLVLTAATPLRTVTVKATVDGTVEGTEAFVITTGDPTSTDLAYNALVDADVANVTGNVLDANTAAVIITPTTANPGLTLITNEAGLVDVFQVRLGSVPAGNVTVLVTSGDASEGEVTDGIAAYGNTVTLTFTVANALTNQTVFVRGLDDADVLDVIYAVTADPASVGDATYNALATQSVFVTNVDLDSYTGSTPPGANPPFSAPTAAPGIPLGGAGAFNEFETDHPSVLNNGTSGLTYEMFMRGRTKSGIKADAIGRSTSNAPASGWSTATEVLSGNATVNWIRRGVGRPSVVFGDFDNSGDASGDSYLMFFSGRFAGSYSGIAVVSSGNGIGWTTPPSVPDFSTGAPGDWDDGEVCDPCVIFDDATDTFHMWYAGHDGSGVLQIGYASAPLSGGLPGTWTRANLGATPALAAGAAGKFDAGGVSAPAVVRDTDNSLFRMYFSAFDPVRNRTTIGYAESATADTGWVKFPTPVLMPADPTSTATWSNQNVFAPAMILDGTGGSPSTYRIWYSGSGTGGAGIGYVEVAIP
jgi:hypothetical protein